eukprot:CAMPEP_0198310598 /NCGR_PEP_ID=MMETSP1450-20131203/2626_1 /TAXON_ID=753684 ORGANISM="Madagascaria erythrocladiodes, Strain CCMP3234" /NCGR_SAMPLE_ID=MMETSP1450 /ASSEMBLY_ACC=CAM_ASM_001115 /LENGTH=704 /DNA_ID=CAMNT_0044013441 /DNA_START=284 /DNA_END=2398 /DNA_ORIENTATION=+
MTSARVSEEEPRQTVLITEKKLVDSMASAVTDDGGAPNEVNSGMRGEAGTVCKTASEDLEPAPASRKPPTAPTASPSQGAGGASFVDATTGVASVATAAQRNDENARKRRELLARLNQIDTQKSELERVRRERTRATGSESRAETRLGPGDTSAALSNQDSSAHHDEQIVVGSSGGPADKESSEVTKFGRGIAVGSELVSKRWDPRPGPIVIEEMETSVGPTPSPSPRISPASPASLSSPTGRSSRIRTPSVLLSSQPGEGFSRSIPGSNTRLYQYSVRIVKEFLKLKEAAPFAAPITELWPREAIPGYFDVVDTPMDLRTVLRNLEAGVYSIDQAADAPRLDKASGTEERGFDPDKFAKDVRLVFRNAMLYNRIGDHFYELARGLLERFEKKFESAPSSEVAVPKRSPPLKRKKSSGGGLSRSSSQKRPHVEGLVTLTGAVGTPNRSSKKSKTKKDKKMGSTKQSKQEKKLLEEEKMSIVDLEKKLEILQRDKLLVEAAASSQASSPQGGTLPSPLEALAEHEMTYEEKKKLGEAINTLPPEKLGKLVQIVAKRSGKAEMNNDEEIELDIDNMDTKTLREMEAYINSINVRKRGKNPAISLVQITADIARIESLLARKKAADPAGAVAAIAALNAGIDIAKAASESAAAVEDKVEKPAEKAKVEKPAKASIERSALSDSDSSDESGSSEDDSSDESGSSSEEE